GLDVSTDAAEPEQVDRRLENGVDQRRRLDRARFDPQRLARLRAQLDRFLRARNDVPALRQQFAIVIVPAGPGEIEQALAPGPALGGIRIRIDENVAMIEGSDE